jgi:hypothetical protein
MPTRMIDFDALWTSDKLAACKESARVEYTWLYGLADAHGTFEINLRSTHSRVSAIRPKLSAKKIGAIFEEFHRNGLLFKWTKYGKTYGFWTGSDKTGRLPKPSERHRYKRFAPDVPTQELAEYESCFGRDALTSESRLGVGVGVGLVRNGDGAEAREGVGTEGETKHVANARDNSAGRPETLPIKPNQERKQQSHCTHCNQSFVDAKEFMSHDCDAKTAGGYECRLCRATFPEFLAFKSHRNLCFARNGSRIA